LPKKAIGFKKKKGEREMKKIYKLTGFVVGYNWYNIKGIEKIEITTGEKGLKEIEKEPLQDYLGYGFQSIVYVALEVYEKIYRENKKYLIEMESKEPIKVIEAGEYNLTEEEEEFIYNPEIEPAKIIRK
jgi:hypothetical protein